MKRALAVLMLLAVASLSGCSQLTIFSNYREIENVEMVKTIGVDSSAAGVMTTIASGVGQTDDAPRIFSAAGATMASALETLEKLPMGKEMILSHAERLMISEEAARQGIGEYLDHIARTKDMRLDTYIYVVKGGAGKLIRSASSGNASASEMMRHLEKYAEDIGGSYAFSCEDIAAALAIRGCGLIMAVEGVERESGSEKDGSVVIVPAGFAIIRDGALTGYLTQEESLGAALLMERTRSDTLELRLDGGTVTINMTGAKTELEPVFDGNALKRVDIRVETQANVVSLPQGARIMDEDFRKEIEGAFAETELERILLALERSKRENADIMALEDRVERASPVSFRRMSESWDDIFPELEFHVSVSTILRRTYDIDDPLSVTGEEETTVWEKLTK